MKRTVQYDIAILGVGVTGAAALWVAAKYTNVRRVLVVERAREPATVNSNSVNNSQTLHKGDIESNYNLEKALKVKAGADLLSAFIDRFAPRVGMKIGKMLIAVDDEVPVLIQRYAEFKPHYPDLQLLESHEIEEIEPMVMRGRDPSQRIAAIYSPSGHAVNYHALAYEWVQLAVESGVEIDILYDTEVDTVERSANGYVIRCGTAAYEAAFVDCAMGSSSLLYAHRLGYNREYALLPIAGSFYHNTRRGGMLKGKVYTMQDPKLPFAAVHGDPAVYNTDETRFGPTARPVPMLERGSWRTMREYLKTGGLALPTLWALIMILHDTVILKFALWNMVFDLPWIGKRAFLRDARKVVPSLSADDITLDKGAGGVRGQPVHVPTRTLAKNADKIVPEDDSPIVFTLAPSPGASYSLANAVEDMRLFAQRTGHTFDEARLRKDLLG